MGKIMNLHQCFAHDNCIEEFVHFTNEKNLPSILKTGVLSRKALLEKNIPFDYNDEKRLDGMLEAISLSVTSPNYKMFYKYRTLKNEANWVVIVFDPQKILEYQCAFFRANAGSRDSMQQDRENAHSVTAFAEMFSDWDICHPRWSLGLAKNEPTNPQAEVMVFNEIPLSCIDRIVFQKESQYKKYCAILEAQGIKCVREAHFFTPRHDYYCWTNAAA